MLLIRFRSLDVLADVFALATVLVLLLRAAGVRRESSSDVCETGRLHAQGHLHAQGACTKKENPARRLKPTTTGAVVAGL